MHRRRTCIIIATVVFILVGLNPQPARTQERSGSATRRRTASRPERRLERAATLIREGNLAQAEAEIVSLLEGNPQQPDGLNLLGVIRLRQARTGEAEEVFKRSLAAAPHRMGARINLGLLYASLDRLDEAAAQFEAVLKSIPAHRDAQARLVDVLRRQAADALALGEREKALSHLLRAKTLAPANPQVLFEFGMVALGMSLYTDAAQALGAARDRQPNEPKVIYALARAKLELGNLADAERLFRRYVELKPDDATGYFGLGYVLVLLRRGAEAAPAFEKSLTLRPGQTESPYQLGTIAYASGDLEAAARWFEQVLARNDQHTGALLGMGQVYFSRKQYEQARASLEKAVGLEPALSKAHYQLGLTLARLGDKEAARHALDTATKLQEEEKNRKRVVLSLSEQKP